MAIIYYPTSTAVFARSSSNGLYQEQVLSINPDTIIYFDTSSNISGISSSLLQITSSLSISSSYSVSSSYAMNGGGSSLTTGSTYPITASYSSISNVLNHGWVDVTSYGALGDGISDDTTAIQSSINAIQNVGGGTVYFPVGNYKITSTITVASASVWLLGTGNGSMIIPSGSSDVFFFTNNTVQCGVEKLAFTGSNQVGGNCFSVLNSHRITFRDLYLNNNYNGWLIQTCNVCTIDNIWFNNCTGSWCVKWLGDDTHRSDDLSFVNFVASGGPNTDGFVWDGNCQTCRIHGFGVVGFRKAISIIKSSGSTSPAFLQAHDVETDFSNQESIYVSAGQRFNISNPYLHGSATSNGITITGSVYHFTVMGGNITSHYKAGIANFGGTSIKLADVEIYNNSQAGANSYSGVECYTGGIMTLVGNVISGSNHAYGINNTGSATRITMNANDLSGNSIAPWNDFAGTIVTDDIIPVRPYWSNSTTYLTPIINGISTIVLSSNVLYMVPIWVTENRTFTSIAIGYVSSGITSGLAELGIYKANRFTGQPTQLIVDAGSVSVSTTGTKSTTINVNLNSGMYYLALVSNSAPTLYSIISNNLGTQFNSGINDISGLNRAFTFGSLPSDESGQTYNLQNTFIPGIGIR